MPKADGSYFVRTSTGIIAEFVHGIETFHNHKLTSLPPSLSFCFVNSRSKSRFGRRRPFIVGGCLLSIFAMLLLGWAKNIAAFFLGGGTPVSFSFIYLFLSLEVRPSLCFRGEDLLAHHVQYHHSHLFCVFGGFLGQRWFVFLSQFPPIFNLDASYRLPFFSFPPCSDGSRPSSPSGYSSSDRTGSRERLGWTTRWVWIGRGVLDVRFLIPFLFLSLLSLSSHHPFLFQS